MEPRPVQHRTLAPADKVPLYQQMKPLLDAYAEQLGHDIDTERSRKWAPQPEKAGMVRTARSGTRDTG